VSEEQAGGWHDAGALAELPRGRLRTVELAGRRLVVGHAEDGFFALGDECPHASGSLGEGMLDGAYVICPVHAYGFHVRTGACEDDAELCAEAWPVRVVGERLEVQLPDPIEARLR
jgi:nitrite reductase/ring-hydroxylating ferredoxin subunit